MVSILWPGEDALRQELEDAGHREAEVNADSQLTMRCSEPGHRAPVAISAPRGPGR